ncbi:scarecrow-like protein 1 [Prunus yedoensis var. nudiflora]|uniref:Scarecrow-like protein 1 n=1 Tax=Prunus yedoensis var. nudiflora TaxID=2094558 RepID=A0A314YWF1_PRUYE|nr:scarecrow-like protein 1 [Prunus yedoensis var. nudiflora]
MKAKKKVKTTGRGQENVELRSFLDEENCWDLIAQIISSPSSYRSSSCSIRTQLCDRTSLIQQLKRYNKTMSLVRPAELSATSYRNPKLYSLKGSNDSSTLSTQTFISDKHKTVCVADPYSAESYENFLDSPMEEIANPSSSGISGNSTNPQDYFESQSPDADSFDEDKMRLKLQELERALLEDNDDENDEEINCSSQSMEVDGEWTDPIQNELLHDSPKESSSSESNVSSISSNKEISQASPQTPKQLLYNCAGALSEGNIKGASTMISELRQMVSIQGDPAQRIAAYMVEGLAARVASSGKIIYRSLKCKEPPSSYRLAAMQVLFEVCPCFKFGFMAANGAIIEACKDEKKVHIIDFDISQGNQYIALIQTLANRLGKPPHLRLTGIDDPESVQRPVGGLNIIGQRLENLAEALKVPFEFQAVASRTSIVNTSMLDCRPGEALLVNFAFQLHHMPDESVSTVNQRDQLLRMVKSLRPKLVTVVEQDCLARDIVNIVACEGEERIERYEVAGKWRARMTMAGFTSCPMSTSITDSIRELIRQYCDRYKVKEEAGALHFGWENKSLIVASSWR